MPIKPMDMQVLLPQVQKAARPETLKQNRQEMAVSENRIEQDKDNKLKKIHVSNLEKKDDHKLKNELDKKSSKEHKKNKKNKKEEEVEEKPVVKHGFDMKV